MSGVVPAKIAAAFTMAELAVLTVIARQCQRTGVCTLHIDAIAALAGCCRTVVKNAIRQTRLLGLILVKERRAPGLPSLTNIVSIISKEWIGWLKLGGGVKRLPATDNHFHSRGESARSVPRGGNYRPYVSRRKQRPRNGRRAGTAPAGRSSSTPAPRRKPWRPFTRSPTGRAGLSGRRLSTRLPRSNASWKGRGGGPPKAEGLSYGNYEVLGAANYEIAR